MSGLSRFLSLGMSDADRRVAASLTPRDWTRADEYLKTSAIVRFVDRITQWMHDVAVSSVSGRWLLQASETFSQQDWRERYHQVGVILLTAVIVNLALTAWQGPRPGWFWAVIPMLAGVFAIVVFAASAVKPRT